jgi:hypothetical protein
MLTGGIVYFRMSIKVGENASEKSKLCILSDGGNLTL